MNTVIPLQQLVIATHNKGKLREFQNLLSPYVSYITSAGELNLPEPEETGTTFAENALLKAREAAHLSNRVALADDSGFCVAALDGAPGLYSARWALPSWDPKNPSSLSEEKKDFSLAMRRVHEKIGDAKDRSAHFICVLALVWPDGREELIEGRIDGEMIWPPRGANGHGYDPVFVPKGDTRTFAEMIDSEKNAISHRGIAVQKLIEQFLRPQ